MYEYAVKGGLTKQVERAVARARGQLRKHIERTHPQVAFGGRSLVVDNFNKKTNHQTILGHFNVSAKLITANVYSNYLQRWYNTGTMQHPIAYGKYKGRKSTYYAPRGDYYGQNRKALEGVFADYLDRALKDIIEI